ncbi:type II secretion system protein [Persicirhabdus sediminis]|uniref:Type II secretion system protein n=2 Tax=Persicirhabdus sediminis TaxID=454144 RepID=A0A8J7MGP2_9BACT|nr:type II secretion system protein [Persicirhabdus sediminis]
MTLLEVVIVISMIAILTGIGLVAMAGSQDSDSLRKFAIEFESMAKRGRMMANKEHKPYQIKVSDNSAVLYGYQRPLDSDEDYVPSQSYQEISRIEFPGEMQFDFKYWGQNDWTTLKRDVEFVWKLEPKGIVEPVSVRYSIEDNYISQEYHPLTAGVRDEEYELK